MALIIPLVTQLSDTEEQAWLAALKPLLTDCEVMPLAALNEADRQRVEVAIVANPRPADLATLPRLQWVQSLWAGVERLVAETSGSDFAIVRMTDPQLALTMAEAVLAWTLYLHREMPRYHAQQTARIWQPHPLPLPGERRIGILGLGNLGKAAALRLGQNGFAVWGWGRSPQQIEGVKVIWGPSTLAEELRQTNILICLLPLTPSTERLLNDDTLGLLPTGAALINFARGAIVDTEALIHHLDRGHLSHAVLDVFEVEPLSPQSPLWRHNSVTVLPHISAPTNKRTAAQIVAQNIRDFLRSGRLPPAVDRELGY